MGLVADGVLSGGGRVTGVITRQLVDREVAHVGVTDLLVVDDMPARKRAMFEAADAFLTLPGGVGTMEEFFEVLCWGYLGIHPRPMGLLNVSGYYDLLIEFIDRSVSEGLCNPRVRDLLDRFRRCDSPHRPTVATARRQWGVEPRRAAPGDATRETDACEGDARAAARRVPL